MQAWRIPLSDLDLGAEEEEAVRRVIRSRWLTLGEEVSAFEREFAELCDVDRAVALSSCTAALHLACVALGVEAGAEVIAPTLTFVATASAVILAGGRPVFADSIGDDDFTLDPDDVRRRITPATRGIICVHYAGYPCRIAELEAICAEHGLFLIEDVAHAPGARWEGKALGTIGDVGCFSFFGNKNLTTGEGGMAIARDPALADRIRLLRAHGMTTTSWDRFRGHAVDYDVVEPGFNYRPTELAAAVGRAQLTKLMANNERRNLLLDRYRDRLASVPHLTMPFAGRSGAAHLAVAVADDPDLRDALRAELREASIQSSLHYPPVHLFDHYRSAYGYGPGDLRIAESLAARAVTLPLYATMAPDEVDEVCAHLAVVGDTWPGGERAGPPTPRTGGLVR
jgi:dTDP-4-amino-4,6-dideoxygalactose transaminase